jgi:hypothetical protein
MVMMMPEKRLTFGMTATLGSRSAGWVTPSIPILAQLINIDNGQMTDLTVSEYNSETVLVKSGFAL